MAHCEKFLNTYKLKDIEGVLLDFDGTIVPSEKVFFHAWQEIFMNKYQCLFTDKEYIEYELEKDTKLIDYLIECNRLSPGIEKSVLMQDVYDKYAVEYSNMLKDTDFSTVLGHIEKWRRAGIRLSIVSTSKHSYIEMFFERYKNYKTMFSYIFCREDVKMLKPNPMVYLLAAECLGVGHSKCLVIEDSTKGVEGAMAAHMKVVKVLANTINISGSSTNLDIPVVQSIENIIL